MTPEKIARLEAAGFRAGDAEDFLDLTPAEREIVERRVKLVAAVAESRREFAAGLAVPMSPAEIIAEAQQDTP